MKEQLIHILDQSVCLSRKQMKEYLGGGMLPEETRAVEQHLNSCALCSLAMEGFEEHSEQALAAISALNSGFLKEHFDNISPQIHLNSIAHAATLPTATRRRATLVPMWRKASLAAAAMLLLGLAWAFQHNRRPEPMPVRDVAMNGNGGKGGASHVAATVPAKRVTEAPVPAPTVVPVPAKAGAVVAKPDVKPVANPTPKPVEKPKPQMMMAKAATDNHEKATASTHPAGADAKQPEESASARAKAKDAETEPAAVPDKEKEKTAATPPAESKEDLERGDESYGKGSYSAALAHYKKGMASTDTRTRYQSMLMAAQCYAALGNSAKAKALLQRVIDDGPGTERRAAKRELRKME